MPTTRVATTRKPAVTVDAMMPASPSLDLAPDIAAASTALSGSANAVALVNAYCIGLNNTVINALPGQHTWYDSFNAALQVAQTHGNMWLQTLGPQAFSTVPQSLINYGNTFSAATGDVLALLTTIPGTPTPAQHDEIVQLMQAVLTQLTTEQGTLASIKGSLAQFVTDVTNDHAGLLSGQNGAAQELAIDNEQLISINGQIALINAKIASDSQKAMASEIGLGIAIFVVVCAVAAAVATDGAAAPLVVGAIGLLGVGGAIAATVIFSEDVKQDYADLYAQQQALSDEQRQVTGLQAIITSIEALVAESTHALSALSAIVDAWAILVAKLTAVVSDLEKAEAADVPAFIAGLDIEIAQDQWAQLVAFAGGMQTTAENLTVQKVTQPGATVAA